MVISVDKKSIRVLSAAIGQLPDLFGGGWGSYYIDAEEPVVERVWKQIEYEDTQAWRVCLHRIQPSTKSFYHPHRHPTAVLICAGAYEMGLGYGDPDGVPPPVVGPVLLGAWNVYSMAHPCHWHYVRSVEGPSFSVMVMGEPYQKGRVVKRDRPRALTGEESGRIFDFFTPEVLGKAAEVVAKLDFGTSLGVGEN